MCNVNLALRECSRLIAAAVMAMLMGCSTTSMFQDDQLNAIQLLGTWKEASRSTSKASTGQCQTAYGTAKGAVNGYIEELQARISSAVSDPFKKVFLTAEEAATRVNRPIGEFERTCLGADGRAVSADEVALVVAFLKTLNQAQRQTQADAMKARLQTYKWTDWPGL